MKITRHPFILLEIFIALTILSMVIIPMSSFPYKAAAKQSELMKKVECKRIYDLAYANFLSQAPHLLEKDQVELGDYVIDLSSLGEFKYKAVAKISKEVAEEKHFLLATTLSLIPENKHGFVPDSQKYYLYIEKK